MICLQQVAIDRSYSLTEVLEEMLEDYRCGHEAALVLWVYTKKQGFVLLGGLISSVLAGKLSTQSI